MLRVWAMDKKLKSIYEALPNMLSMKNNEDIINILNKVKGLSTKTISKFIDGLPQFKTFMKTVPKRAYPQKTLQNHTQNTKRIHTIYLFSGCRPTKEEKERCFENGIEIVNSFSKQITALVVKDVKKISAKMRKAQAHNIPIISYAQFTQKYHVL